MIELVAQALKHAIKVQKLQAIQNKTSLLGRKHLVKLYQEYLKECQQIGSFESHAKLVTTLFSKDNELISAKTRHVRVRQDDDSSIAAIHDNQQDEEND